MDEMEETLTKELNSGSSACQWHGRADGDAHSHTLGGACFTMGYLAPDGSIINPSLSTATLLNPLCCEHNGLSHNGLRHKQAAVFCRLKPMVLFALWVIWKSRQVSDPPSKDRFPPFQHQPPSSCCFSMLVTPKIGPESCTHSILVFGSPVQVRQTNLKGSFFIFSQFSSTGPNLTNFS